MALPRARAIASREARPSCITSFAGVTNWKPCAIRAAAAAPEGACDGVTVGAADTAAYFPLLRGRRVAAEVVKLPFYKRQ